MSIFDSLFGSNKSTSSSSSSSTIPSWMNTAVQNNYGAMQRIVDKPYQPYTGQRVASLNPLENQAYSAAGAGMTQPTQYGNAVSAVNMGLGVGPQSIQAPANLANDYMQKENPYKSVSEYMNPYTQGVLDPVLRQMQQAHQGDVNTLADQAMGAGAFGDTRHGLQEAQMDKDYGTNVGDATNQVYASAFTNAQQQRQNAIAQGLGLQSQDVANNMTQQAGNAQLGEQYANRQMTGGNQLASIQGADTQNQLDWINAAAGAGQAQQANDQANKDFNYAQYLEGRGWDQESINSLMGLLQGSPYNRSTVTNTTGTAPNSGAGGALGAILGSLFK